jgi:hypothetical protein
MKVRRLGSVVGIPVVIGGLAAASYPLLWRDWCLTWGATADEATRTMPGDDLLADPDVQTTRAIRIDAAPEDVWPWVVQMGSSRGGAYTYDWIENLLGLDMHSADEILPQFQDLAVGDVEPLGGGGPVMRVEILDPARAMVLRSEDGNWVWAFGLQPDGASTRLVSRNRIAAPAGKPSARLMNALLEPGSLVMERKMLIGIKQRVERTVASDVTAAPSVVAVRPSGVST